ncbi:MAG: hypothetical protein F9K40_03115 [Kofleriaceae bacterium]|nr:MAG: hypothetical protein F9K40_03115 [Kofleriaceae bacterium]
MSWRPVKGKPDQVECSKHRQVFAIGHACPMCTPEDADDSDKVTEASMLAIEAKRRKLPSILDHEQNWNRLGKKLEKLADKQKGGVKAKLYDCAMKAYRSATTLCEWREDWVRIERSEKLALGLDAPEDGSDAPAAASGVH